MHVQIGPFENQNKGGEGIERLGSDGILYWLCGMRAVQDFFPSASLEFSLNVHDSKPNNEQVLHVRFPNREERKEHGDSFFTPFLILNGLHVVEFDPEWGDLLETLGGQAWVEYVA